MPIKACADKLKREIEEYGYPPDFSKSEDNKMTKKERNDDIIALENKSKGKKVKPNIYFNALLLKNRYS